ncbi:MAG: LysR family transcriptional regulator [Cellulosilyticaceae bacterium]
MEFNQLRYIVEIVEAGSIAKAASSLFISQPHLSSQISQLEKEIGRQLFIRGNRGVSLTKEGVEVYHYAKQVVTQFEMTEQKLLNHINENQIKIATCGCEMIEPAFFEVCKVFNKINYAFHLEYCNTQECLEKVATQEVDIAIIPYTTLQYKKIDQFLINKGLTMQELFKGRLKVHVSDRWLLSQKEMIQKEDLKHLIHVKKHILFSGLFSLEYEMRHLGLHNWNKSLMTYQIKTYEAALAALPSFAITTEWDCPLEINPHLKRVAFEGSEVEVRIVMIKRQNDTLREEILYFLQQLQHYK